MPKLQWVMVWPPTGHHDRPWLDDPDEEAFAKSARSVCELYSEAVRAGGVPARHSEFRLVGHRDTGRSDVHVTVHSEMTTGEELAVVLLPSGIAGLSAPVRAYTVLETIHGAAVRLARERGWDIAVLESARAHAMAAGLRYRWQSPPKSSPDRRHYARAVFRLYDDGYGKVVVEIRRRADDTVVGVSEPTLAFSTSAGFDRSAQTLRWVGKTRVEMVPYAGLSAGFAGHTFWADNQGLLTVDIGDTAEQRLAAEEYFDVTAALEITVITEAESGPAIRTVGGGPLEDVPDAYSSLLHWYVEQLTTPPWQAWWASGSDRILEIWYDFSAPTTTVTARRFSDGLRVTIRRPASTFAAVADPAALARSDVEAMLATVRRRTGLGAHPPLVRMTSC